MSGANLLNLPFELVLQISQHLEFSDIWYLGTCSKPSRKLSYQLLKSQYQIDLIKPRIINPFGQSIHAAVAYLMRHGKSQGGQQQQHIIQSVANHLAIGIYDRMPSKSGRAFSLDFLLNKSLAVLLEHCLFDSTLHALMNSPQETNIPSQKFDQIIATIRAQQQQQQQLQEQPQSSTGVLMVDFLSTLHETLGAIIEEDLVNRIHHHLLMNHLQRQLRVIRSRYQHHHSDQSSYSENKEPCKDSKANEDFKLYIKFLCSLAQTNLISSKDLDDLAHLHINHFFLTKPSDVSFSSKSGFKIYIRNHNEYLSIINTVTYNKRPAYHYQWRLWLEETQLRLAVLLDLLRAMIQKNCSRGEPPDFIHITAMLQETVSALTLSETLHQTEEYAIPYEIPLDS